MKTTAVKMTPFKTKVLVEHYESMGYELKVGNILLSKNKDGSYVQYAELIKFDTQNDCWLGKTATMNLIPILKTNRYIEIVAIPFDQYVRKLSERAKIN